MRARLALLLLGVVPALDAARLEIADVAYQRGTYHLRAEAWLDAPPDAVRAALLDFPHLGRLSPAIRVSRVVGQTREGTLVFTRTRACAGWFCRDLRQTQLVVAAADTITATALPEASNVAVGHTVWTLGAEAGGTRLAWTTVMDPAFFVPPLIGPPLVKAALRRECEALTAGIERVARGEWQEPAPPRRKPRRPRGAGPERVDDG